MTADRRNMDPDLRQEQSPTRRVSASQRSAAAIRPATCLHTRNLPYDSIAPKARSLRHRDLFQSPFPRGSPADPAITLP